MLTKHWKHCLGTERLECLTAMTRVDFLFMSYINNVIKTKTTLKRFINDDSNRKAIFGKQQISSTIKSRFDCLKHLTKVDTIIVSYINDLMVMKNIVKKTIKLSYEKKINIIKQKVYQY